MKYKFAFRGQIDPRCLPPQHTEILDPGLQISRMAAYLMCLDLQGNCKLAIRFWDEDKHWATLGMQLLLRHSGDTAACSGQKLLPVSETP